MNPSISVARTALDRAAARARIERLLALAATTAIEPLGRAARLEARRVAAEHGIAVVGEERTEKTTAPAE